jgi:Domain of unknown function (DUF6249)
MEPAQLFVLMEGVVVTASISLVAVIVWLAFRAKEREEYYRSETLKKIAEAGTSAAALEYLRETDRIHLRRTRGGLRLGGLVAMSVGIALMVFLRALIPGSGVHMVGLVPLLVGVSLFGFAQLMMPRE